MSFSLALDRAAWADMYLNSAEPLCSGDDPTVLMCDDFEDGDWVIKNCDQANSSGGLAQTDGWCGTIYWRPDPQGTNFGRCGGLGAAGTDCAITSDVRTTATNGGQMGLHAFKNDSTQTDIYLRWYHYLMPGFQPGHEKVMMIHDQSRGQHHTLFFPFGSREMDIQTVYPDARLAQNQGNGISLQNGRWYYIEMHSWLASCVGCADGGYELWIDDCGASGTGCTGPGTMRLRYANQANRPSAQTAFLEMWLENWANTPSSGEERYDQFVIATRRVGPMSPKAADVVAPGRPGNLGLR